MRDLHHPAVDAALSAAATLLGMEVVFVSELSEDTLRFRRVHGRAEWDGIAEGACMARSESFCHRLVAGAPAATSDAASDPHYRDVAARSRFGITSYVGVPIVDDEGRVVGTLCGLDRDHVPVPVSALDVLGQLAKVVACHAAPTDDRVVIRRTPAGWRVGTDLGGDTAGDLTSAMVLADLLADDGPAGSRPPRPPDDLDELGRLRLSVGQLEHALAARVVIEQAIGVLAERQRVAPRTAFERLRKAARTRGRKVHELAREIVASVSDPAVPLPPELAGRR